MKDIKAIMILLWLAVVCFGKIKVTNMVATPRKPWDGMIDITFDVEANDSETYCIHGQGHDKASDKKLAMKSTTGDVFSCLHKGKGTYHVVWNAHKDYPYLKPSNISVSVSALELGLKYLVLNLMTGVVRTTNTSPDLNNDICRKEEMWLRWIPPGAFMMGSPENELGRWSHWEIQHQVTLTKGYYIGIFEVTQTQWKLIMGDNPSDYAGETRPVEYVSYDEIRGSKAGAHWPLGGHAVDSDSFLGKLREKMDGLLFDLPTEAQWEYACRAGTTTALNSGKNLTSTKKDPNMAKVGRYGHNKSDKKGGFSKHTTVGSYLPNAWGLYDMHGNVNEWCLDWFAPYSNDTAKDSAKENKMGTLKYDLNKNPTGPSSGEERMLRGGCWDFSAWYCRSAHRFPNAPSIRDGRRGFRIVCNPLDK
ncbi:MAG: formylglycine-generating enzyme family protein [Victivallales bacterium]|nr:formylglycine-generating enzyme family protein [Victivallales bacterium]